MRVLILGHSYVRDLEDYDDLIRFHGVNISYRSFPGRDFRDFNRRPELIEAAITGRPDIVVVIFGGNSILDSIPKACLFDQCRKFYSFLRKLLNEINPSCKIVAAQCELRFYKPDNRHCAPGPEEFRIKRNYLNSYIKRMYSKDNLLIIAGPGRLDHQKYYRSDGIHLNDSGLRLYASILSSTLWYIINNCRS